MKVSISYTLGTSEIKTTEVSLDKDVIRNHYVVITGKVKGGILELEYLALQWENTSSAIAWNATPTVAAWNSDDYDAPYEDAAKGDEEASYCYVVYPRYANNEHTQLETSTHEANKGETVPSYAGFYFKLDAPDGAVWTAHLTKETDFRFSRQLFLLRIEKCAESHSHSFSRAVKRGDLVEGHRVLILRFCRGADSSETEVVKIQGVDLLAASRQNPDAVKVRVPLDLESSGESLPLIGGMERKTAEHRIIGIAVAVGIGAEVDLEALLRRVDPVFAGAGLRIEGDFHFAGFMEVEVFQRETVGAESPHAGNHHTSSGISSRNRDRIVDPVGMRLHFPV